MAVPGGEKVRGWCVTLNNPTEATYTELIELCVSAKYGVIGEEVGEQSTPHLQGFVYFVNKQVMPRLASKPHWERMKGTPEQAAAYCRKGEQPHSEWEELNVNGPTYGKNAMFEEWGVCPKTAAEKGRAGAEYYENILALIEEDKLEELPARERLNN